MLGDNPNGAHPRHGVLKEGAQRILQLPPLSELVGQAPAGDIIGDAALKLTLKCGVRSIDPRVHNVHSRHVGGGTGSDGGTDTGSTVARQRPIPRRFGPCGLRAVQHDDSGGRVVFEWRCARSSSGGRCGHRYHGNCGCFFYRCCSRCDDIKRNGGP